MALAIWWISGDQPNKRAWTWVNFHWRCCFDSWLWSNRFPRWFTKNIIQFNYDSNIYASRRFFNLSCARLQRQSQTIALEFESGSKKSLGKSLKLTKGETSSTVYEEKTLNPRLSKPEDDFIKIMDNLNLAYPKKIDVALPWNLNCGADPN